MSSEQDKNLNTIKYIYDDIRKIVKSCVIKYDNVARSCETIESKRSFDRFLIASRQIDTFDSYPYFSAEVIRRAGILDIAKIREYAENKHLIPKEYRHKVVAENRKFILETFEEQNNYYRMLIGLPDISDEDYVYVDPELCERYHLDPKTPIHLYDDHEINSLEYHMNDIMAKHPDKKYINFLGKNKVDLIRARTAKNFEIIRADMSSHVVLLKLFFSTYNLAREYFMSVIYVKEKYNHDNLYDNFIAMNIMIMAIQRVLVNTFKVGVERDFYDLESIRAFFNSYGVPFFETLPIDYQRLIMKRVNILLRSKSTDRCLYDITKLLFLDRVTINEYYLVKEQLYDENDIPLDIKIPIEDIDGNVRYVEDINSMYDIYFQAVDIQEKNVTLALENSSNRYDYYEVTMEDPHWWDDDDLRMKLTETEFNYIDTKYIGVNIMYNLTQMMFETVYFINMLVDKKNDIHKPKLNFYLTIKLPRITASPVSIFDAVILLCALVCKKNGFVGNIIKSGTKILSVMGFDFEENFKLIKENIRKHDKIYDQETLKYFEKMNIHSKDDINALYSNMVGLAEFCIEKMNKTDDYRVYQAYKGLYDAMMVKKYTTNILTKENGEVADTYLDYLNDQAPFLADFVNACDKEQTGIYIDHILGTLNELIPDLEYLSTINGTDNIIVTTMVKLIEFFKSYTVDLRNINILYVLDSRRYNMIRMVSEATRTATIDYREWLEYYLDTVETLSAENFINDFLLPLEMTYKYIKIVYGDKIFTDIEDDFSLIVKAICEDVITLVSADSMRFDAHSQYQFEIILEHLQKFVAQLYAEEKDSFNEDWRFGANINVEKELDIRYSDLDRRVQSIIDNKVYLDIEDMLAYDFNILIDHVIKSIENTYFKGKIYNNDIIMKIQYVCRQYFQEIAEYKDEKINIEDLYDIIINFLYNENIIADEKNTFIENFDMSDKIMYRYHDHEKIDDKIDNDEIIKFYENIRIYYE